MTYPRPIAALAVMGVLASVLLVPGTRAAALAPDTSSPVSLRSVTAAPTPQYALQSGQYTLTTNYSTPSSLAVDPSLGKLFSFDSFNVWSVDLTTGDVSAPITLNQSTGFNTQFAVDTSTHRLWALQGYTQLAEIDTQTWSVVATFTVGNFEAGIAVDPITHHVFLSSPTGQVEALDGTTGAVVASASGGGGNLAVDPGLGLVYALPSASTGVVTALRTDTLAVARSIAVAPGETLARIKVSPSAHRVFVSGSALSVRVLDGSDLGVIADVAVSSRTWTPTTAGDQILSVADYSTTPDDFLRSFSRRADVYSVATGRSESHLMVSQTTAVEADPSTDRIFFGELAGSQAQGYIVTAVPSTPPTPVYRFWSPTLQVHFYTASAEERDGILARYPARIWTYEGIAYSAFLAPSPGTVPLFRFWSPRLGDHFYTINAAERDHIIAAYDTNTWRYEGIAFYVYPPSVLSATLGDTRPVARFWSPDLQNHFYTASTGERDQVIATYPKHVWTYEGDDFRVPTD